MRQLTQRCLLWLLLLWPLWMTGWPQVMQAEDTTREYQLKAAFLVNFAKFISWPEPALAGQQEFTLCVVGDDPFGPALAGIEKKTVSGRAIRVVHASSLKKIPACQMLFVSRSEADNLSQLAATLGRKAVLTVSDLPDFIKAGGHIQLVSSGNRLSFAINHTAMKEQGLQANASLLSLAATVQ